MSKSVWIRSFWWLTLASFAAAVWVTFAWTPEDKEQQIVQKIFYVHLPIAINTFLACVVVFVGSVGYLWQRKGWWDALAESAAKVAVVLCSGVLLTGMIWGHVAWNTWWSWTPRLTFSFMLWLLYVVYLLLHASVEGSQRRAMVSAVCGVVAFLDVPLVYLSSRLLRSEGELHPKPVAVADSMKLALVLFFVAVTLMTVGMIAAKFKVARGEAALSAEAGEESGGDSRVAMAGGGS